MSINLNLWKNSSRIYFFIIYSFLPIIWHAICLHKTFRETYFGLLSKDSCSVALSVKCTAAFPLDRLTDLYGNYM